MTELLNPYLPDGHFIPDGEPHLFDHRIYLYGSHDVYGAEHLCEGDYEVWSADPEHFLEEGAWHCEGICYRKNQDPYLRKILASGRVNMFNNGMYAPDVVEMHGKYWMYYGIAMTGSGIAVACADRPEGPFRYYGRVTEPDGTLLGRGVPMVQLNPFRKNWGIHMKEYPYDPAVLVDEGHVYLYFGVGYAYVVELDPHDMCTILEDDRRDEDRNPERRPGEEDHSREKRKWLHGPLLPASGIRSDQQAIQEIQDGWHMGNGLSIRRAGRTYYLSYYAVNADGRNGICYSASSSPFGPFAWCGVLITLGTDGPLNHGKRVPNVWQGNTHGGMFCIERRWYQNYHRQSGHQAYGRSACLSEIPWHTQRPEDDGKHGIAAGDPVFERASFNSQIAYEGGVSARQIWPSVSACWETDENGETRTGKAPVFAMYDHRAVTENIINHCILGYRYLSFDGEERSVSMTLQSPGDGKVVFRIDDPEKGVVIAKVGTYSRPSAGREERGETVWKTSLITRVTGVHALYILFSGQNKNTAFLDFQFE